jgi:putative DNA primase/helicase
VHVFGPSSIGKSAMLAAGASVWGRGGSPGYVRSWRATANGLEGAAASATDTCLVLDELGVGEARDVGASVYALANGSGKQRARRDGSLQEPKGWRVSVLSSGELPVETKIAEDLGRKVRAGQTIRLLDVPADRRLGFGAFDHAGDCADAGKLADAIKNAACSAYGTAGPEFVRRIMAAGIEQTAALVRERLGEFIAKFVARGSSEQIARAAKKFALIGIAGEMATLWGVTPWAKGDVFKAARLAFERWLETRGGVGSQEERQAIEQVRSIIVRHGDSRFDRVDPSNLGGASIIRDRLGWVKGEGDQREWWVPSEIWKAEVCNGLDPTFVARTLESRGMLRRGDRKNLACAVTPEGSQKMRCYVLTAAILQDDEG